MGLRKFYFITTAITLAFLFASGSFLLLHLSSFDLPVLSHEGTNAGIMGDMLKPFAIGKEPLNFLLLIGDKAEANTDTMLLVHFNPSNGKINMLSIPRDTKVDMAGLKIPKINSLYSRKNGGDLVLRTTSRLLNIDVKYYVYFNLSTFRKIVDLLGGVYVNIPVDMDYDDPTQNLHIHLKKGKQLLDGKKAEQYLRFRHPNPNGYTAEMKKYYDGSDLKRIEAQQQFIMELVRQKANILYLPKLNKIIDTVYGNIETNVTMNEVTKLVKSLTSFSADKIKTFTLPGDSVKENGIWYYRINEAEASRIIDGYFSPKS